MFSSFTKLPEITKVVTNDVYYCIKKLIYEKYQQHNPSRSAQNWRFECRIEDFQISQHFSLMNKKILIGPKKIMSNEKRICKVNIEISVTCQVINNTHRKKLVLY